MICALATSSSRTCIGTASRRRIYHSTAALTEISTPKPSKRALRLGIVGRRLGMGRTLGAALLVSSLISVLTPLAGGSALTAMIMLIIPQIIGDAAMMVFGIHEMSLRQMIVPERALGRANATFGFVAEVVTPLGALTAGILATLIGARFTLGIAVLGGMITAVYVARTFGLRESAVSVEVSR